MNERPEGERPVLFLCLFFFEFPFSPRSPARPIPPCFSLQSGERVASLPIVPGAYTDGALERHEENTSVWAHLGWAREMKINLQKKKNLLVRTINLHNHERNVCWFLQCIK